jgi:hypothetical protein
VTGDATTPQKKDVTAVNPEMTTIISSRKSSPRLAPTTMKGISTAVL